MSKIGVEIRCRKLVSKNVGDKCRMSSCRIFVSKFDVEFPCRKMMVKFVKICRKMMAKIVDICVSKNDGETNHILSKYVGVEK